jgi:hypothetical protein
VVPIRELEELVRKSKLSPQLLKLVVVFRLKVPDDPFKSSTLDADLLREQISSVL